MMSEVIYCNCFFVVDCCVLVDEVEQVLYCYVLMIGDGGEVWVYEVDGFGNQLFMDDVNLFSLFSFVYFGVCLCEDVCYQCICMQVWSVCNFYFFSGCVVNGIGGLYQGLCMIWLMLIIMCVLISDSDVEIVQCLCWFKIIYVDIGFMYEVFDQDDLVKYICCWFVWVNSLFGELIVVLVVYCLYLLQV